MGPIADRDRLGSRGIGHLNIVGGIPNHQGIARIAVKMFAYL
jgi:hypothetical protein